VEMNNEYIIRFGTTDHALNFAVTLRKLRFLQLLVQELSLSRKFQFFMNLKVQYSVHEASHPKSEQYIPQQKVELFL
jgi:hypothetical protein